jgi:histidinol-phosphate aminotransferase
MLDAITPDTRIVFISNPNNPTGTMVDEAALDAFMEKVPDHVVVVFDEAYIELLPPEKQPNTLKYINRRPHVYVLRTFSKTYGLAGLRVGYGLAAKADIDVLHHVRQPFNVNAMAQVAARAALKDEEHVTRTRKMVTEGLVQLEEACDRLGLSYVPSVANFMLIKVGEGRTVFEELQQRQIIVRPMNGYGLPEYVRVTIAGSAENTRLIEELEALKEEGIIQS